MYIKINMIKKTHKKGKLLGINSSLTYTRTMESQEKSIQVGVRHKLSFLTLPLEGVY